LRCHADKHLFADDLSLVLVDEFEQRDNHGEAEAADQDVENAGNVAQSERALRRTAALNSMRSSRGNSTAASPPTKHHRCPPAPDPDILKRRGGKTMYRPRRQLAQMHTTNYIPFIRAKAAYCKKIYEPIGSGPLLIRHWCQTH